MAMMPGTVLLSDLDGTFYCGSPDLAPLAGRLLEAGPGIEVVFVSSRPVEDLVELGGKFGWAGDCIAENGAEIAVTRKELAARLGAKQRLQIGDRVVWACTLGEPVTAVERALKGAFDLGGLVPPAVQTRGRRASCLLEKAAVRDPAILVALESLQAAGYQVQDGGEWVAVWMGPDKGGAATRYLEARAAVYGRAGRVAGIGNAANDRSLLEVVDLPFAILNPGEGHHPALAAVPGVILLEAPGCDGWIEAVTRLRASP